MKVFAVISEFNPFHNGHRYLFEQLRLSGATHIVAIMSGSFVQRGEPAVLSKYTRAKCAAEASSAASIGATTVIFGMADI